MDVGRRCGPGDGRYVGGFVHIGPNPRFSVRSSTIQVPAPSPHFSASIPNRAYVPPSQ